MRKLLTLFLIITVSMSVFAGDPARKGTSGAEQLLIPVGARSIATGQAFISHFSGIESIYYNPAGLDREGGTQAMFNYMNYIADIDLSYFAVSAQLEIGSVALTYKTLNFGDIPVTTVENPDGTGQLYSPDYFVIGLTYSKLITDRVSAGVNFNFIHEGIMNTAANGFAIDFGVQYRFTPNFSLGASVKNIGTNMAYTGEDLKTKTTVPGSALGSGSTVYEIDTEGYGIPSYFELSLAYTNEINESNSLSIGGVFRNNNSLEDAARVGAEYNFNDNFFLRGGYDFVLENTDQQIWGFTAGAGISYDFAQDMGLAFDYAYRDVKEFPTANHIFTLILRVY
jgi:opacity protein-like surface antigen